MHQKDGWRNLWSCRQFALHVAGVVFILLAVAPSLIQGTCTSGTLSDASGSLAVTYSSGESDCEWLFTPQSAEGNLAAQVSLNFKYVSLTGAEIHVYEGSDAHGVQIYSCISCSDLPSIIQYEGPTMFLKLNILATGSASNLGFEVEWFSTYEDLDHPGDLTLSMHASSAEIASPSWDNKLPYNLDFQWLIQPYEDGEIEDRLAGPIYLMMAELYLPDCSDTITIYDGSTTDAEVLAEYCGIDIPAQWVITNQSSLLIRLQTDDSSPTGYFLGRYWTDGPSWPDTDCGILEQPLELTGPSMLFTDGTTSSETETKGANCDWRLKYSDEIWLVFYRVSIKDSGRLVVYEGSSTDGEILYNCDGCGELYPAPIQSTSGEIYVTYFSNTATGRAYTGFEARYFSVYDGSYGMGDGELWLKAAAAKLELPGVEGTVPDNLEYTWYICPHDIEEGQIIILSISDIYMEDCTDQIIVYDGISSQTVLATLCDTEPPKQWIKSTGQSLRLEIAANDDQNTPVTFVAAYYSNGPQYRCGISSNPMEFNSHSMVFSDGHAGSGDICQWIIDPSEVVDDIDSEYPLVVLFTWMEMPSDAVLIMYDGDSVASDILMECRGCTAPPPHFYPSSGKAFITYYAGEEETDENGFEIRYFANYLNGQGIGDGIEYLTMPEAVIIPPATEGEIQSNLDYYWMVEPQDSTEPTIIAITGLNLDCEDSLTIYDGLTEDDNVLEENICGTSNPDYWIQASGSEFLVKLETDDTDNTGSFEIFYFTEGPRYRCGHATNGVHHMKPFSFMFSDGSGAGYPIEGNVTCQWKIEPEVSDVDVESIVLIFDELSMKGAALSVYDGSSQSATLLWSCDTDCRGPPGPIRSTGSSIFVYYESYESGVSGEGFTARYYSNHEGSSGMGNSEEILTGGTGVLFPPLYDGSYPYLAEYLWHLSPSDTPEYISLMIEYMNIADCDNDVLVIYDGSSTLSDVLAELCDQEPVGWLRTTGPSALIQFKTNNFDNTGDFKIHWFSDGSSSSCGLISQPGILTFPSYWMSDGSTSTSQMVGMASCSWLISPEIDSGTDIEVVLSFSRVDLEGAELKVYDGSNSDASLLWYCDDCSDLPPALLSSGSSMFMTFSSSSSSSRGLGFAAHYFTSYKISGTFSSTSDTYVLNQPTAMEDVLWLIEPGFLSTIHEISVETISTTLNTTSGSCSGTDLMGERNSVDYPDDYMTWGCGVLKTDGDDVSLVDAVLVDPSYTLSPHGKFRDYRSSPTASSYGCAKLDIGSPTFSGSDYPACNFAIVPTESAFTVSVMLSDIETNGDAGIAVYEGSSAAGLLLWSCKGSDCPSSQEVTSECGKIFVVVANATRGAGAAHMKLEYAYVSGTPEYGCADETGVYHTIEQSTASLVIVWTVLAVSLCVLILAAAVYSRKIRKGRMKIMDYEQIHLPHFQPPELMDFYPRKLATLMLHNGECLICYESNAKVFELQECKHRICIEDMTSYLNTALGDASMFPLKCPMHHMGCTTVINPAFVRKVLPKSSYQRFSVFHERAVLGEGMDCIFCKKFVSLPPLSDMKTPMVSCPNCHKHFCMKCKIAWHIGATCEEVDGEQDVENWAEAIGASKCPSCEKFIEKSDAETCNHMVHKATDVIPCVRERTDYCYLCGTEVAPGYPHIEIDNPTVNHFPDGVFQECRKVMEKKTKKMRRAASHDSDDSWGSF